MNSKYLLQTFIFSLLYLPSFGQTTQWASKVIGFSSEYVDTKNSPQYRAIQALGKPNVLPAVESSPCAWSPAKKDSRTDEWIKVGFEKPMQIRQIAIGESYNAGSVTRIYAYDIEDNEYEVYKNKENLPAKEGGQMLTVILPAFTTYKVAAIKVVLSTLDVEGWNHIDCIGISSSSIPVKAKINVVPNQQVIEKEPLTSINSPYDEVVPVISPDGKYLYFDRKNHPDNTKSTEDNDDIWYCVLVGNDTWTPPIKMPSPINDKNHNYICSVTPDGNSILLGNVYNQNGKATPGVSIAHKTTLGWTYPEKLNIENFYNYSSFSEYCLSNSRDVLILSLERDDTYGVRDLYVSFKKADNTWTKPKNMGPQLNTAGFEITPFLASDNKSLYFSSNGFSGYGSNDMYVSKRLDDTWTNWSEPQNLGNQFNTDNWDASYSIDAKGEHAYFVSYKNSLNASADIYRSKLPEPVKPEPVTLVKGTIYNAKTKQYVVAEVTYEVLKNGKVIGTARSNPSNGGYKIVLPNGESYGFHATAKGYFSVSENVDISISKEYTEIVKDLHLVPIEIGQTITLNNVFFPKNQSTLEPASFAELDRLVRIMKDNPSLEILVEGHTEVSGKTQALLLLSQMRAKAVKDYLVSKGIAEERISSEGYGGTRPITLSQDPIEIQKNRRVECKVVGF